MTRKDYKLIADALNRAYDDVQCQCCDHSVMMASAVGHIAEALACDNERFDRERFEKTAWGKLNK